MQSNNKNYLFPIFLLICIVAGCVSFEYLSSGSVSVEKAMTFTRIAVLATIVMIVLLSIRDRSERNTLGYFRAIVIFTLSYFIVHFQLLLDVSLGISKLSEISTIPISPVSIAKSGVLAMVGLASSFFSYSITTVHKRNIKPRNIGTVAIGPNVFKVFAFITLIVSLVVGRGFYFRMSYGQVDINGTNLSYLSLLFNLFVDSYLLISVVDYIRIQAPKSLLGFIRHLGVLFNLTVFVYLLAVFTSGDRGPVIYISSAYVLASLMATGKKLSGKAFIALVVVASLVISLVGIVRRSSSMSNMGQQINEAYTEINQIHSLSPTTRELAGSARTLFTAVDYFPDKLHHTNGLFQVEYISQAIPFSSRVVGRLTGNIRFTRSTALLTWLINGDDSISGVGTTCIADVFIDLGMLGVILLMLFWGVLLKKSEELLCTPVKCLSIFEICLYFMTIILSVYIPRSAILFHSKDVLWLFLLLWLCSFIHPSNK